MAHTTSSKNPDKVLPNSIVPNSKNSGVISWILSFFGARKGRGLALKSKTCSEPELESPRSPNPAKSERSAERKSVSDLLEEFNKPNRGSSKTKTLQQRKTSRNGDAKLNFESDASVNTRDIQSEEGNSSEENLLGAKSEVASSSQSSSPTNSDSSSANSSDHEQTSTNMEILAKKLDKINLSTAENIKRGNLLGENISKPVSEEAAGNTGADDVKIVTVSRSSSSEEEENPKKSVKALGALLQMKGPLPMPGMTGFKKATALKNAEENEENAKSENKISEDQFTSEKLKVNLRQRAAKAKRPVSRKFRNSMQLSEVTMLED